MAGHVGQRTGQLASLRLSPPRGHTRRSECVPPYPGIGWAQHITSTCTAYDEVVSHETFWAWNLSVGSRCEVE
eukprot:9062452-Alexandrium_andersonii.AAC.1